jgi:hypothetical protein
MGNSHLLAVKHLQVATHHPAKKMKVPLRVNLGRYKF